MADETPQDALARLQAAEAQCADNLAQLRAATYDTTDPAATEAHRLAIVDGQALLSGASQAVADQIEAVALADAQAAALADYAALDQETAALAARLADEYPAHVAALGGLLADLVANALKVKNANVGFKVSGFEPLSPAEPRARWKWGERLLSETVVLPSFTPGYGNEWPPAR